MELSYKAEESCKNIYTIMSPFGRIIYVRRNNNEMIHYAVPERFFQAKI